MYNQSALDQYQQIGLQSKVSASSPHSLVAMLLDGILERVARARGAIERNSISEKGAAISAAIKIVDSLRASLDHERGGEIADNLGALYDYVERRLVEANARSDESILAEINTLVLEIKAGWDAIPAEQRGG